MTSEKTEVIRVLFFRYWDEKAKELNKTTMTLQDVADAIRECNKKDGKGRSDRNPANFLKDVVRSRSASRMWPKEVADLGFTGEQRTGAGDSFEFVRYSAGQTEPFPDLYRQTEATPRIDLQSLSIPAAARGLGRSDEAWLIQTAVNLRVLEQHMATVSSLDVQQITHLQMTVKLRETEIDAVYLADVGGAKAIITCEAKKHSERILVGQIASQVRAAMAAVADASIVVPIAIRSVRDEGIHVMEFKHVTQQDAADYTTPVLASEAIYRLIPRVKGI